MHSAAAFLQSVFTNPLVMDRKANRLDESAHGARVIRVGEKDSVHTCRQNLLEHPGVGVHGRLVDSIYRYVNDDGGRSMAALGGSAGYETAHVFLEAFDIEGRVFHVVADIVGESLRILLA